MTLCSKDECLFHETLCKKYDGWKYTGALNFKNFWKARLARRIECALEGPGDEEEEFYDEVLSITL